VIAVGNHLSVFDVIAVFNQPVGNDDFTDAFARRWDFNFDEAHEFVSLFLNAESYNIFQNGIFRILYIAAKLP
jgi:hypothetical protein